ncbi:hypothetical protein [Streptomyces sp. NPDC096068]|uniref:hypothetical protein n=1 Tax=Streptomyces sp. NPDC096068 TaxID=3155424 RepID=UPI0033315962
MSFDEEWRQLRNEAATRLNSAPAGPGAGTDDYKVVSAELKAVGNEAQELFHWFERDAFHAGAQTDTASKSLDGDGFLTGSAMWTMWDTWRGQAETLLSACAHIHNHLEYTAASHAGNEEQLITNFSIAMIDKHFT